MEELDRIFEEQLQEIQDREYESGKSNKKKVYDKDGNEIRLVDEE